MSINEKLIEATENQKKMEFYLQETKKAIIGRGGDIPSNADIDDLPETIFNIPANNSLSFIEDSTVAYQKAVPKGSEEYALLKELGGMTYKCNNLIPFPYAYESKTIGGIDYSVQENGAIIIKGKHLGNTEFVLNDTGLNLVHGVTYQISGGVDNAKVWLHYRKESGENVYVNAYTTWSSSYEFRRLFIKTEKNVDIDAVVYPMLNVGTTARPHEQYYEGLRDSKITEIVSHGKNLFDSNNIIKGSFYSDGQYLNTPHLLRTSEPISIIGGETYVVSCNPSYDLRFLYFYGSENEYISNMWMNRPQNHFYNFTAPTDARFVNIGFEIDGATNSTIVDLSAAKTNSEMQLERGSVKTEYTPYREPISYPIPEEIQNLDGWGEGVTGNYQNTSLKKTCSNIYDFNSKNYTKSVSNIITLDGVSKKITGQSGKRFYVPGKGYDVANTLLAITPHFTPKMWGTNDYECWVENGSFIVVLPFASVDEANIWLEEQYSNDNPVCYQYALEEPIITSIKDDIEIPSFIEAEGGGSLEFVNEHKNAVPSTIKYTTKVGN